MQTDPAILLLLIVTYYEIWKKAFLLTVLAFGVIDQTDLIRITSQYVNMENRKCWNGRIDSVKSTQIKQAVQWLSTDHLSHRNHQLPI